MIAAVRRASDLANRVTEWALVPVVLFFAGLLIVTVFSRYIFQLPIITSVEMTRLAFVWATFLGVAAGVKRGVHVRVVAFVSLLHGSFLLFGLLMVWYGYFLTVQMSGTSFPPLGISQSWLYGVLPVTGALMVLHALSGLLSKEPVDLPLIEETAR